MLSVVGRETEVPPAVRRELNNGASELTGRRQQLTNVCVAMLLDHAEYRWKLQLHTLPPAPTGHRLVRFKARALPAQEARDVKRVRLAA